MCECVNMHFNGHNHTKLHDSARVECEHTTVRMWQGGGAEMVGESWWNDEVDQMQANNNHAEIQKLFYKKLFIYS